MEARKRGLGRGLGALIPGGLSRKPEGRTDTLASTEAITPNPYQPREAFDESGLEELTASVRDRGLLQPLVVRRVDDGRYELIAGERRWRAAQRAGLTEVPIIVREADR